MRIEVAREKVYIPIYNGNRERPVSEQIRVFHRFLTPSERSTFVRLAPIKFLNGKMIEEREYIQDEEGIARCIIIKIENLEIAIGDETVVIDSAAKLFDTASVPYELVQEIKLYCFTATPEITRDPTE